MKRNTLKHSIATFLVVLAVAVLGAGNALAHQAHTQSAISFSANPVPEATTVTITGTVTYTGTFGGGPSSGHSPFPSNGTLVVGENLQIQQAVDADGNPVACEDPNLDDFVTIDQGNTNSSGQFSTTFETADKGGQTLGFRSHHPAGTGAGPGHSSGESKSDCLDLVITASEGCSQGFWSTHTGLGPQDNEWPSPYTTSTTLQGASTFQLTGTAFASVYSTSTLLDALGFGGGEGAVGGFLILMKQAVAALLNAAHPDVAYPRTVSEVQAAVNAALATGDRDTMITLGGQLEVDNTLGCPLPLEE